MNTLIVIESLTIVNLLNKVQFPFVKVFPPQMLSSSSEGAIVQAVPIAFAPVTPTMQCKVHPKKMEVIFRFKIYACKNSEWLKFYIILDKI